MFKFLTITLAFIGAITCLVVGVAMWNAPSVAQLHAMGLHKEADNLQASQQRLEAAKVRLKKAAGETCRLVGGQCDQ